MANAKQGFAFYRNDTDRYQDIKIKRLKKEFKCDGVCVYDYILNELYRVKGYYLEWDTNVVFDIAEYWNIEEDLIVEIVRYCCSIKLFDLSLFSNKSIITSKSIQYRFKNMCQLSKRSDNNILEEYNLLPGESDILLEEYTQTSGSLPQRIKDKIIKEKRIKEGEEKKDFIPPTFDEVDIYFKDKMPEHFWDFAKCSAEAKKFIAYYAKTSWKIRETQITNWEVAADGWITNDGKFQAEKKQASSLTFPDHYNLSYMMKLSEKDQKKYREHLNNLGIFYLGKDDKGVSVWGSKN